MFLPLHPPVAYNFDLSHYEDTHSDCLIKVLSASLLHCKVTLFPFIIIL